MLSSSMAAQSWERFEHGLEVVIVRTVQVILMIMTSVAAIVLAQLVVVSLRGVFTRITSADALREGLQHGFGGALVVLLGLELLDTLKNYFTRHRDRAPAILLVALIAVGRHIVQIDFDHASSSLVFGLAGLILALTIGFHLVKKTEAEDSTEEPPPTTRP